MNKNAIQKYAIWARTELIEQVKQRAFQYDITEEGYGDENATVIAGRVLEPEEKRQRQSFIEIIKTNGFKQTVEEVAYTWFNRFVALRYMEVNDLLPTHVRVFSDSSGIFNPEILKNVLHLDLEGLNKIKVSELLNDNKTDELYRYLLLTQCNALNSLLPEMFERLGTYTEMLLPNNILRSEGVIGRLVKDIPEEDFHDAVQIIGWLYQYYNTDAKQAVFDGFKKNVKITKENIPAATQLFTPDWIVRYMVENSLGRLWLESRPGSSLRTDWKYYLDEAEQTPEVAEHLRVLRSENIVNSPEDIKVIDPCMGSGHILVYAFDVLIQIYTSEGYSERDAAKLILEKNIYGLEIDRRAYQLAYFALMMKARQYNRRILIQNVRPQVYEPTGYADGMEYGSLIRIDELEPMPEQPEGQLDLFQDNYFEKLNAWNFRRLLAKKYDVVVTNPPYMGNMPVKMSAYVVKNYPISKYDLYSVMLEVAFSLINIGGFISMITQQTWMFLSSFEGFRKYISQYDFVNMLHLGARAFDEISGEVVQTTAFVFRNSNMLNYTARFIDLRAGRNESEKIALFENGAISFESQKSKFAHIPGMTIAYWLEASTVELFNGDLLSDKAIIKSGIVTGNNDLFLKMWYEIEFGSINFHADCLDENIGWVPMHKGGGYRKYYGLHDYVMNLHDIWYSNKVNGSVRRGDPEFYFLEGITWSTLSTSMSARMSPKGFVYDTKGSMCFANSKTENFIFLAIMNSKVCEYFMEILSPTLDFNQGAMGKMPLYIQGLPTEQVLNLVGQNIGLARNDWDSFETSWDFKKHPLICDEPTITSAFSNWRREAEERFDTLKANEENLNQIFIEIYGLQDELTPEVKDKDITVRRANLGREIRSLISYAIGCIFGRYSLDSDELAYAGGDWDTSKYKTLPVDKDNILLICNDEYFDDDIVGRFVDFVKTVYGVDTLDENLRFIADALGGRGTPREIIRSYFLNDFYKDHLKIYQKRPIYWMFDSGKKNGFKALIYMHRYSSDLIAKLRTDYVHEQQERYRTQLSHIMDALNTATGAERVRLLKRQIKLTEQLQEITVFEEKVHHLADQKITIDLDDGVKKNYALFTDVLAKI